ncbi:hypothetical protein [Streptomyces sp. NPDC056296]|uniref:hypothetical protein n=1 Tax=Streptomyces sp. NPDC056296 TaxID=3345775 RepID=UPI0035E29B55
MTDLTLFTGTPTASEEPPSSPTAPVVHGAVIISAIETAWREIRRRFTDISVTVPPTVGAQDPTKCAALRTGRRFVRDGHLTMELQISSGTLGLGGRPMMEGLLHHAAHGLALTRGVGDTSSAGRWHNRQYGRLAREVGLTPPARAAKVVGLAHCPLSDTAAATWAEVISALNAAAAVQLEAAVESAVPPRTGRAGYRFPIICACAPVPRRQHVTPFFFWRGPLLCGLCLAKFRPADDVEVPAQAVRGPGVRRSGRRRGGSMTALWQTVLSALQDPDAPGREETIAHGAAALAPKRTPQAAVDDVLEVGLYEFGVIIEPRTAQAALAAHRVTETEQER